MAALRSSGVEDSRVNAKRAMERMLQHEVRQVRTSTDTAEAVGRLVQQGNLTEREGQQRMTTMAMEEKKRDSTDEGRVEISGAVAAGANFMTTDAMLEELLDGTQDGRFSILRCIKTCSGLERIDRVVERERRRRASPYFHHRWPYSRDLVATAGFEAVIGCVMMCNGITIGLMAGRGEDEETEAGSLEEIIPLMEHVFTAAFVLEIAVRLLADGWTWIWTLPNMADTWLIVVTGVIPLWLLDPLGIQNNFIRTFSVLRVLRLIRVVRMVRTVKAFRTFWKLIQGIFDSGRTLLWMCIILFAVLYLFAIFATVWIGKSDNLKDNPIAQEYFGNAGKSAFTLFQIATLDGWASIARPLMKDSPNDAWRICFVFFGTIMVCTMVVLNLVTAVIVQNAFDRAKQDEDVQAKLLNVKRDQDILELREIFWEIDEDGSGTLSREEYENALMYNEKVKSKFDILDIAVSERSEIWELLESGSGEITVDAFADCLRALHGDCKAKDSFTVVRQVAMINKQIDAVTRALEPKQAFAELVMQEAVSLHRQLAGALAEIIEFVALAGVCVPQRPVKRSHEDMERIKARLQRKIALIEGEG